MNKIKSLLKELCPCGVPFVKLGDYVKVLRGKRLTTRDMTEDGKYPVYHGGVIPIGNYKEYNRKAKTTMIINVGASAGTVSFSDIDFWSSDGCFCLEQTDKFDDKFLYYLMTTYEDIIKSKVRKAGIPTLDSTAISNLLIPVPPKEIQIKIAEELDKFLLLLKDLSSELEERKIQYEYYREKYFAENNNKYNKIKLGEIIEIQRGGNFQKKDFVEKGKPCIHYGQIYTYYNLATNEVCSYIDEDIYLKQKIAHKNDIIMAVTSENIEDVCKSIAWLGNEDIAVSGHSAIITHKQNPKYLSYFFQTKLFEEQKRRYARGVKVVEFQPLKLNEIEIALPPIEEQNKIVEKLDNFHNLIYSKTDGIPTEIQERERQYEYYKNKFLKFDKQ